ncbi:endolytic transglycosylase MltG [Streptomyces reniochalinae]|uniref:Endolytic murein transglycosylase n=1 Tax=Streptomyces reniochalinae TaxID=2250578 RepID=A0A367EME6_9ACTN|nr:endolytic transglycosylase MltG [Streptomyces reniochalinae]RCG18765.1 endolytic transglycosylase MltG [Streptomyces reniochalinae]
MTEYGPGQGSQAWDPDDPLYGDQQPGYPGGWNQPSPHPEQQYAQQQYAEQQYEQQYPQQYGDGGWFDPQHDPYASQGHGQHYAPASYTDTGGHHQVGQAGDPYGTGQYATGTYPTGAYPSGEYGALGYAAGEYPSGEYSTGGYPAGGYAAGAYGTGEYPSGEYGTVGYPSGEYATGQYPAGGPHTGQYPAQGYGSGEYPVGEYSSGGYAPGEYSTGEYPTGEYATGQYPAGAYPAGEHTGETPAPYGYRTEAVPPQHPHEGGPTPGPSAAPGTGADPETGWDPGPDQGERAFFLDRDDDDPDGAWDEDDADGDAGPRRGRRGGSGAKRGRGCALVISAALIAGVGVLGYVGYDFYQSHFAPAPDYAGKGSGEVMVDVPEGASLSEMGQVLRKAGVVKSAGAFVEAADGKSIQAGTYTLRKRMSGAGAVEMMRDPASQNGLIIAEGWRAKRIYEEIDKKLDVDEGTTKKAAASGDIGLPKWAHGKPEGFLFPSRYSVGKDSTPKDVLRKMVDRAEAEYAKTGLQDEAKKAGKTPEEIITIASLVQAEAQEDHEFGKVSRVIYNRLDKDMALGFDSTINYAMGRSTLNTSVADTKYPSPYNTYLHKGLPPGPIGNPGHQAITAALDPTAGDWLYFVTVKRGDTRFTDDPSEHRKNVEDFNKEQRKK